MIRVLLGLLLLQVPGALWGMAVERPPNLVIIFVDDLGYGDLGVYGHPTIRTPHLDRMAAEGMKFTQFYAAAPVCTPSRAALLTGRLAIRSGMARGVLFPHSKRGLPADEITIAEALRERGYATAAIGKWHLGHLPAFLPTSHGFDHYFGIPYSNDMDRQVAGSWNEMPAESDIEHWNVPLMRDEEIVERPADQRTITKRYTEEAVGFIRAHRDESFFVYLAHTMPHVPLFRSEAFAGKSRRGLYGDVVEELDWSVGQVLDVLRAEGLGSKTLVVFTSDNGPWLTFGSQGGSAGLLRGGKGMTWEGGVRVPAIAWWPGTVPAGTVNAAVTSTLDLFPTALTMAGAPLPDDRVLDGYDLMPLLSGASDADVREILFYYRDDHLYAVRYGPIKAHFVTEWAYEDDNQRVEHDPPLVFHLDHDPGEQHGVSDGYPGARAAIRAAVERHRAGLEP